MDFELDKSGRVTLFITEFKSYNGEPRKFSLDEKVNVFFAMIGGTLGDIFNPKFIYEFHNTVNGEDKRVVAWGDPSYILKAIELVVN